MPSSWPASVGSAMVQKGERDAALAQITDYRPRNAALNAEVASVEVQDNLIDLNQLEHDLNRQFEGTDQRGKQNLWAKANRAVSYQSRRDGQSMSCGSASR